MSARQLTKLQEAFLHKLHDGNFSPALAYKLATGCKLNSAQVEASKLLRIENVRKEIIDLIENTFHNLQTDIRIKANALHSKLLTIELKENKI